MKYREAVKKIKSGWNETKRVTHMKFEKEDCTWCETNKETLERVAKMFEKNLSIKRDFDMELLEQIKDENERFTAAVSDVGEGRSVGVGKEEGGRRFGGDDFDDFSISGLGSERLNPQKPKALPCHLRSPHNLRLDRWHFPRQALWFCAVENAPFHLATD